MERGVCSSPWPFVSLLLAHALWASSHVLGVDPNPRLLPSRACSPHSPLHLLWAALFPFHPGSHCCPPTKHRGTSLHPLPSVYLRSTGLQVPIRLRAVPRAHLAWVSWLPWLCPSAGAAWPQPCMGQSRARGCFSLGCLDLLQPRVHSRAQAAGGPAPPLAVAGLAWEPWYLGQAEEGCYECHTLSQREP